MKKSQFLKKLKNYLLFIFPNFKKTVEQRQQKIIVSLTSYYKRFGNLTNIIQSIKNQILQPNKILLFLYEKDFNKLNLNLSGIEIIKVNEDIKSHKKYYYAMMRYRDYAIITMDDDIYYSPYTVTSLYKS